MLAKMKNLPCARCLQFGRTRIKSACPTCRACVEHGRCRCLNCPRCSKRNPPSAYCRACQSCKSHHVSARSASFPSRKCEYLVVGAPPKTFMLNALPRTLGVEFEIAELRGVNQNIELRSMGTWSHDGSVRPSEQEFGANPLLGDDYVVGIARLLDIFNSYGCTVNETCGFHVHVDGIDMSAEELRRVLVGFACIQDDLFGKLVHADRKTNTYCGALKISKASLRELMGLKGREAIMAWLYNYLYQLAYPTEVGTVLGYRSPQEMLAALRRDYRQQLRKFRSTKYMNEARRQALNLHSWMMRGTLEFRCKEGTLVPADVLNWPLWCGWFVERTAGLSDATILQWLEKPPSVLDLTRSWYGAKGAKPAPGLAEWVANCAAHPSVPTPRPQPQQEAAIPRMRVRNVRPDAGLGAPPDWVIQEAPRQVAIQNDLAYEEGHFQQNPFANHDPGPEDPGEEPF